MRPSSSNDSVEVRVSVYPGQPLLPGILRQLHPTANTFVLPTGRLESIEWTEGFRQVLEGHEFAPDLSLPGNDRRIASVEIVDVVLFQERRLSLDETCTTGDLVKAKATHQGSVYEDTQRAVRIGLRDMPGHDMIASLKP